MRRLALILLLALAAAPLSASWKACNGTLMTQNVCRALGNTVLFYDAPTAALIDLRDAIVAQENYQATVRCTDVRSFVTLANGQPSKILATAGVVADSCTLNATVANPQSTTDFADAVIDRYLRNYVIEFKHRGAVTAVPAISTISTPDVGGN